MCRENELNKITFAEGDFKTRAVIEPKIFIIETANGKKLPKTEIKPYVQYGVGLQKKVKDNFTAYGQAMVQNGGRNGISLTAGLRWAIGNDKK